MAGKKEGENEIMDSRGADMTRPRINLVRKDRNKFFKGWATQAEIRTPLGVNGPFHEV